MTKIQINMDDEANKIVSIANIEMKKKDKRKTIIAIIKQWHKQCKE
jgi:hypothetical protein